MKTAVILVAKITPRHQSIADYLSKNLLNTQIFLKTFSEVSFKISQNKVECKCGNVDLGKCNLVYFRQIGHNLQLAGSIAYFLYKKNVKFIDKSFENIGASGDKLGNIVKLALNNIPVPPSMYCSREELLNSKDQVVKEFGYPIFAKSLTRQRREGIFIIHKLSDFKMLLEKDRAKGFLLQKYINIEKEFRVVTMGGKVIAVHLEASRKIKDNQILVDSEESIGGWIKPTQINRKVRSVAIKGAKALELNITGADVAIEKGTGNVFVFEINRGPGFTLDPQVSPELPELEKYISKLLH